MAHGNVVQRFLTQQAKLIKRKSFKECLGQTGTLVSHSDQAFTPNKVYVHNGACAGMCVQTMCSHVRGERPSGKEMIENGQWLMEGGTVQRTERLLEFCRSRRINFVGHLKGNWLYDELDGGNYLATEGAFYHLVVISPTQGGPGHALLVYQPDAKNWCLYDPNFGTAQFPSKNGCTLAFKLVMQNLYPDFGPYFPFVIYRFSPW
jgi:hypothetical protein